MVTVAIGMPAHNDVGYVAEAIESLLCQSHGDFTLFISDDASTDGTEDVCRSFARQDPRVRYERHPENIGIAANMAHVRDRTSSTYFAWAADDDVWHPSFLEVLTEGLNRCDDAVLAFCPYQLVDESGAPIERRHVDYSGPRPHRRLAKLTRTWSDAPGYGLFRRSATLGMRFPRWWGPNRNTPHHVIFPSLYHALALGNYVSCGEEPLWSNRQKQRDHMNYQRHLHEDHLVRGASVVALRKANVWYECTSQTAEAAGLGLAARVAPRLALRMGGEVARTTVAKAVRVARREASFW